MKTNDAIFQRVAKSIGTERFSSLAMFWSSEETRIKNVEDWNNFWKQGREARLKGLIKKKRRSTIFQKMPFHLFLITCIKLRIKMVLIMSS